MKSIIHKSVTGYWGGSQKKLITKRKHFKLIDFIKKKISSGWTLEREFVYEIYVGDDSPLYFNKRIQENFWLENSELDSIELPHLRALMSEKKVKLLFEFQQQIVNNNV